MAPDVNAPAKGSRVRTIAAGAGLSASSLVLAFALVEIVLRLTSSAPVRFARPRHIESADKSVGIDSYPSNPRNAFELDLRDAATRTTLRADGIPDLDAAARHAPFAVRFRYNQRRCRDREFGARIPGVARVLVIGDSFTEGQGVSENATFVRRIERALHGEHRAVEVLNCGRRGRDFPELANAFDELTAAYDPDVVLYAMVLNDAVQSPEFRARQGFLNDWIVDRRRTLSDDTDPDSRAFWQSRFVDLARDRIESVRVGIATTRWYNEMYAAPNQQGWDETQRLLRRMDTTMRGRGGRFVVVLLPLINGLQGRYPFESAAAAVQRACSGAGITFHDAIGAVRGRAPATLWVHPVDMHPNESAHALLAEDMLATVRSAVTR